MTMDNRERRHADLVELRRNARHGRPRIGYQDANDMPLHIPEPATRGERWRRLMRDLGGKLILGACDDIDSIGTAKEVVK